MNPYISGRGVYYHFDETSPVTDLTLAPDVTTCNFIVGCSFFMPLGFGFGSVSGQFTVSSSSALTIVLRGPLTTVVGRRVEFGVIPGLTIQATNSSASFPVTVSASGDDLTLDIPVIAPGTYHLTQPFLGVFRN